jgi:hypothetical protein
VRLFCANWIIKSKRISYKGWRQMKADALA